MSVTLSKDEQRFIAVLKFAGDPKDNRICILDRKGHKLVDLLKFRSFLEAEQVAYKMSVWDALVDSVRADLAEGVVR